VKLECLFFIMVLMCYFLFHVSSAVFDISIPFFNMTSHLRYGQLIGDRSTTSITITFYPVLANGLLLYSGDITKAIDFISLSIVNSHVEFRYNLGSGNVRIVSDVVTLFEWHTVVARRSLQFGSLTIDNGVYYNGTSIGTTNQLNIIGFLYLGGVDSYSAVSRSIGVTSGFIGCIDELIVSICGVICVQPLLVGYYR